MLYHHNSVDINTNTMRIIRTPHDVKSISIFLGVYAISGHDCGRIHNPSVGHPARLEHPVKCPVALFPHDQRREGKDEEERDSQSE